MKRFLPIFDRRPQQSGYGVPGARQRGVSVITAIFLLLLMAGLAAFMANIVSTTHLNMASDIGGSRAYQAARAGAEWGLFQLDPNGDSAGLPNCFPSSSPPVPEHSVTVACSSTDYTEGGRNLRIYLITSTASPTSARAPGIQRQVQVTVEKCRDPGITAPPYDC